MHQVLAPDEEFAVDIADPPWVPRAEIGRWPEDPELAIDGGDDGLDLVRACLDVIAGHLVNAGSAVLQVGPSQVADVHALAAAYDELAVVEARELLRGALVQVDRLAPVT